MAVAACVLAARTPVHGAEHRLGELPFVVTAPDDLALRSRPTRASGVLLRLSSPRADASIRARGARGTRALSDMAQEFRTWLQTEIGAVWLSEGGPVRVNGSGALYRHYVRTRDSGRPIDVQVLFYRDRDAWLTLSATTTRSELSSSLKAVLFSLESKGAAADTAGPRAADPIVLGATGHRLRPPADWLVRERDANSLRLVSPDDLGALSVRFEVLPAAARADDGPALVRQRAKDFDASRFGQRITAGTLVAQKTETVDGLSRYYRRFNPTVQATPCDALVEFVYSKQAVFRFTGIVPTRFGAKYYGTMLACIRSLTPIAPAAAPAPALRADADPTVDTDGDGYPDLYEAHHGTDKTDAASIPNPTFYVDATARGGGDGSKAKPFNRIADGLSAATNAYEIVRLADGVYKGAGNKNLNFRGRPIMLASAGGPTRCVLDCERQGRAFWFSNKEDARTVLLGLTIINGDPRSGRGAAIGCQSQAAPLVVNCTIRRCRTSGSGGALSVDGGAAPYLRNCRLTENRAGSGGAVYCSRARTTLENCVIAQNKADYGGGLYTYYASTQQVYNCTIADNTAARGGSAIANYRAAGSVVHNSIIWGNGKDPFSSQKPIVTYSVVQGGYAGDGNVDQDPRLTKGYRLQADSPCIDAGAPRTLGNRDADGETPWDHPGRADTDGKTDIGADEFVDTDRDTLADAWEQRYFSGLAAKPDADPDGPDGLTNLREYTESTNPAQSDTDGDTLSDGAEVLTHGTSPLNPDTDEDGMRDAWEQKYGLDPCAAADMMTDPDQDGFGNAYEYHYKTNPTNNASQPAATLHVKPDAAASGADGSAAKPFAGIRTAVYRAAAFDIIQLSDGLYKGQGNQSVYIANKPIMIRSTSGPRRCVVDCENLRNGFSFASGVGPRTVLSGLTIRGGLSRSGAGVNISSANPTLVDCVIEDCTATGSGGALYVYKASPTIKNCILRNNRADCNGGGAYVRAGSPIFQNCVFARNTAKAQAGGVYVEGQSEPVFQNCAFAGNHAHAAGAVAGRAGRIGLVNTILWGNVPNQITLQRGRLRADNCLVQGGWPSNSTAILTADPRFLDPEIGNLRLRADSPCVDAGTLSNATPVDLDGETRPHGRAVDIGPDEYKDTNGDGFADFWVATWFGNAATTLVADADLDGDGYANAVEYAYGCNPTARTFDDPDTLPDEWEWHHFRSLRQDDSTDYDHDRVPEKAEYAQKTRPDRDYDRDNDEMADDWEIFRFGGTNVVNAKSDSDGDGDLDKDEYWLGSDPTNKASRADYTDSEKDGLPDVWERYHFGSIDEHSTMDFDGDRLTNGKEYEQRSNPALAIDDDEDRLPDDWERAMFGSITRYDGGADVDGDGLSNYDEWRLGLDPNDVDTYDDGYPDGYLP